MIFLGSVLICFWLFFSQPPQQKWTLLMCSDFSSPVFDSLLIWVLFPPTDLISVFTAMKTPCLQIRHIKTQFVFNYLLSIYYLLLTYICITFALFCLSHFCCKTILYSQTHWPSFFSFLLLFFLSPNRPTIPLAFRDTQTGVTLSFARSTWASI